ncbi:MAG: hypothetical protein WCG97_00705 [bacterium]
MRRDYSRLILTTVAFVYSLYYGFTYTSWHFIDYVDLIFHEAGHSIFSFLGEFVQVAAGSGFQITLPLFISIYFFYLGQKVSGSLCLMWVGINLFNVSVYAEDATAMQLNLLGGDSVIHDWNYLLSNTGLLKYTEVIASDIYILGWLMILVGTILGFYYSWNKEIRIRERVQI